jgi:isoleucyl-tRNA synthetase
VLQSLVAEVNEQMEGYYLYNVVPPTLGFIDHLTNWYVRRSRRRFWRARGESGEGDTDKLAAFATLYEVLTTFIEVLAPVLPFITETIYQDLVARHDTEAPVSVHHRSFPDASPSLIDLHLEDSMAVVREVVRLGRNLRKREGHRVRQPLARLTVLTRDPLVTKAVDTHTEVIAEELNIKEVLTSDEEGSLVHLSAKANFRKLGPELGPEMPEFARAIASLGADALERVLAGGTVSIGGREIGAEDMTIERTPRAETLVETGTDFAVALDVHITDALLLEGVARDLISRVQRMRRDSGLDVTDRIALTWWSDDPEVRAAIAAHHDQIAAEVLAVSVTEAAPGEAGFDLDGRTVGLRLTRV